MTLLNINIANNDQPLVQHAADELQRYVRTLFGFSPSLGDKASTPHTITIKLNSDLPDQSYRIQSQNDDMHITAGSPRAVLWAVYELISEWHVHYLIQGDVMPDDIGEFHLPDMNVTREPVFKRREFRVINDMANSGVFWSLDQYKDLFDQLAKLRFTGIYIQTYPHQPWAHYSFRGIERSSAGLCYGWKHRIHDESIGREQFSKLADDGDHTNPDFAHCKSYDDWMAAGKRFMRGLFDAARARGLEVTYDHPCSEVPDEFAYRLKELSVAENVQLPREGGIVQKHFSRHGLTYSGGNADVEPYRTPLNPVYVDLMEASFVAHIQAYPDAERYAFTEQEFPPGGAGADQCWQQLDEKYGLSKIITLDQIKEQSRKQFFYVEGRAFNQAMGAIQSLYLYDQLINVRNVLQYATRPDAKIIVKFFSEHLQPLVEHVFSSDKAEFNAIVDYLPARVAERMDTLEYAKSGNIDVIMTTTIEDDNVGFLPQLNTQFLHETVTKMHEYGLIGYMFRQFDVSQHEPCMAYMVESAWDKTVTPEDSYLRYAMCVVGEDAAKDLVDVYHRVEQITEAGNAMIGHGFMWPSLYRNHWEKGATYNPQWEDYIDSLKTIDQKLREVLRKAAPRGKRLISNYMHFIRFGGQIIAAKNKLRAARAVYDQAQEIAKKGDMLGFHPKMGEASNLLFETEKLSQLALETWAKQVADPSDLGSLAGLNAYGHDWLRGKATEVYWDSQCYGLMMEDD